MDNGILYSQSAEEVAAQLNDSDDELSYPELATTSPGSKPLDKSSPDTASIDKSTVNHKQATPTSEQKTDTGVKSKRTVRFADDLESQNTLKPHTSESVTSPAPRHNLQSLMAGQKRGRTANGQADTGMPRKRGRPAKKRGPARRQAVPPPSSNGPTQPSPGGDGGSAAVRPDTGKRPSTGTNTEPGPAPAHIDHVMKNLMREVFVVNALVQDGGLSIPWALAVQMHAVFASGLPEPRGEVYVKADLAAKIRGLFDGFDE